MAHDVRSPHIFQDGPGQTASGEQVMDNFDAIWAAIDTLVAPGTIRMSGTASPETGWLLCNGSDVSRTTYAALFTKLGTTFGVGDGSTTFTLPDLRGRAPIGAGTGAGLTARSMGAKIGEEAHALTAAENAAHTHGPGAGTLFVNSTVGASQLDNGAGTLVNPSTSAATTANSGSGTAHNTMQPVQVVNFFIKT